MAALNPDWFAYLVLLLWPLVALYLFAKLHVRAALLWTILGGYLLLPVGTEIKFEMVPAFDKRSIPNLAALLGCVLFVGRLPKFFRGFGLADALVLLLFVVPFLSAMGNTDVIRIGDTILPAVGAYDAGSAALAQFIYILPFFLGRQFLRTFEDNAQIFRVMTIAGLFYSLLMLFEIRMSPQLHSWTYGYFPHDFAQQVRDGGFRPVVFIGHGLLVAFFAMTTTVASAVLWRTQIRVWRFTPATITGYLGVILLLCKTASAALYGAILVPVVRWASPRSQLRLASTLVIITLAYPLLRVTDVFPTSALLEAAYTLNADRAESLKTRFDQEDQLLAHAWERPWFGWGRFGRNRVFNGYLGRDSSITDGHWIITMGEFGLFGFIAEFGLLALVVLRAAGALKLSPTTRDGVYLAALALIVAINMIDLLPNSSISPWTWLLVGALLGRAEELYALARRRTRQGKMELPPAPIPASVLNRSSDI
jgi:hypothetical protein